MKCPEVGYTSHNSPIRFWRSLFARGSTLKIQSGAPAVARNLIVKCERAFGATRKRARRGNRDPRLGVRSIFLLNCTFVNEKRAMAGIWIVSEERTSFPRRDETGALNANNDPIPTAQDPERAPIPPLLLVHKIWLFGENHGHDWTKSICAPKTK
jgi:hypothetical protein